MKIRQITLALGILLALSTLFNSCKTEIDMEQQEIDQITAFIVQRGLDIDPRDSGLYFKEVEAGSGEYPVALDTVYVNYTGYFLSGILFDSNAGSDPFSFVVDNVPYPDVIGGWDEGLKLLREGGEAVLIVPSWLGYGASGYYSIPGYTPLFFEIELLDIKFGPNHN